jgi:putative N-acetylmannosamine-6-phosphate epimerase
MAASWGSPSIVKLLVSLGANTTLKDQRVNQPNAQHSLLDAVTSIAEVIAAACCHGLLLVTTTCEMRQACKEQTLSAISTILQGWTARDYARDKKDWSCLEALPNV